MCSFLECKGPFLLDIPFPSGHLTSGRHFSGLAPQAADSLDSPAEHFV